MSVRAANTLRRAVAVGAIVLFVGLATSSRAFSWALVKAKIRQDFPEVKRITTAELAEWLSDDTRRVPLLLDVRTAREYAVSHLQNSRQIDPEADAASISDAKDQPIVTYCSVGYRSSRLAEKLRQAGFTKVQNLEGSIFKWANEGRPVYRDGERAEQVHPYNRMWGLLLRSKYRAPLSAR